jgi:hypothetical protein
VIATPTTVVVSFGARERMGSSVLLVMAVEGSRRIVFLGGNQAAYRTRCRSRSNLARPYICRLISFNR